MTACSKNVPVQGTGDNEQLEGILEIYTMGPSALPWKTPPDDWVPVVDDTHPFGKQSAILSTDNPIFSHEGVSLSVSPYF
ncbi:MAG: hypothetical protein AB1420_12705 [Bacillota bacterium]